MEEEYYPNGDLKLRVEIQNGKKHGTLVTYYPNGVKESESQWENNQLHGRKVTYYENTNIKSQEQYQNGLQHGPIKTYTIAGVLTHEANYKLGKRVGEVRYYRPNGKLERLYKYNESGPYYSAFYDKEGKFEADMYEPTYVAKKDTVQVGEEYSVIIGMPDPLVGEAGIIIGGLDPSNTRVISIIDTLHAADKRNYAYSVKSQKSGWNYIGGYIDLKENDSSGVGAYVFTHKFFVAE